MAYQDAIQALANPTRRAVFEQLRYGPSPVGELAAELPVTRPAVSQHLKVLKNAGLVRERRMGTRRIYSVQVQGLTELRRYIESFWNDVMTAFEDQANRTGSLEIGRNSDGED